MHYIGPTEHFSCVLEPHCECLHKVKKMSWYPHATKLLHHIENCPSTTMLSNYSIILKKCVISNKAINMHSRGSMEQYFYV